MNVLVTASTFPAGELDGSRPRFVYDLAEALAADPAVTRVLALAPHHPGAATRERMGSVEVIRFRYWWPTAAQKLTPNMRQQIRASLQAKIQIPFFMLAQLRALRQTIRRNRVDVVNAHWIIPQGLTVALLRGRRTPRFRHALHVHAGDVYLLARLPFGAAIARFVVARSDRVFASGSHVRDTLDRLLGYHSGAQLQPMGVHGEAFRRPAGEVPPEAEAFPGGFLLFVGRLVEKKGTVYLLRALPRVLEAQPGLGLLLVGSGPEEAALRAEVERLALEPHVRFLGHRPHEEIVALLQHCRAAVVPSIIDRYGETEGMPTVVLESMAAGVRVVGSAVDGIPDIIRHGENGWLAREKDPGDLAEKLLSALSGEAAPGIARAARETAAGYDWARIGREYARAIGGDVA